VVCDFLRDERLRLGLVFVSLFVSCSGFLDFVSDWFVFVACFSGVGLASWVSLAFACVF